MALVKRLQKSRDCQVQIHVDSPSPTAKRHLRERGQRGVPQVLACVRTQVKTEGTATADIPGCPFGVTGGASCRL